MMLVGDRYSNGVSLYAILLTEGAFSLLICSRPKYTVSRHFAHDFVFTHVKCYGVRKAIPPEDCKLQVCRCTIISK